MTNLLRTDGYKFSMAQAGYPLRRERFYFSFRRGGWQYVDLDLKTLVKNLLPTAPTDLTRTEFEQEADYLAGNNYRLTEAMRETLRGETLVEAVPKGTWICNQEPLLTVEAPSFVASQPEANITMLNYQIQLTTWLYQWSKAGKEPIKIINDEHEAVVRSVFEACGFGLESHPLERIDDEYRQTLDEKVRDIVSALDGGDVGLRIVEGGLRSAICPEHHRMVLRACAEYGIVRTSNVAGAREIGRGLIPSGTAGHEHSQRCGSDRVAYTNYADRVCGLVSCLADTWSTLDSGLPETIRIAKKRPERQFLFRLDSGDRASYFMYCANRFKEAGVDNVIINVAGDVNAEMIRKFEQLRKFADWEPNRLSYMIGGQLTAATLPTDLRRGKVAAVYKLCETGGEPTMKMGDDVGIGKRSVPGKPTTFRRLRGNGPLSIVGQRGERIEDYVDLFKEGAWEKIRITNADAIFNDGKAADVPVPELTLSPATQALVDQLVGDAR